MHVLNILIIFAITTLILVLSLLFADKVFGKEGLLMIQIAVILISNFIVLKRFPIADGKSLTMSVLVYPFIFVGSSIISNKYGEKVAKKYANLTILANLVFVTVMTVGTFAIGTGKNPVDEVFSILSPEGKILPGLIGLNVMGWLALYLALFASGKVFSLLKNKLHFTVATIISAFIGDFLDSIVFVTLGLCLVSGFLPWNSAIVEIVTMVIGKTIVSTTNTLLLSAKGSKEEHDTKEEDENFNINK